MDPNAIDLYGGLAGVELAVDPFSLGEGITVSKTYARLIAPFIMSFVRPRPGNAVGTPVRRTELPCGFTFEILAQLYIPKGIAMPEGFDMVNMCWLVTAVLRLRTAPNVRLVVMSSALFAQGADLRREMCLWPLEFEPGRLAVEAEPRDVITVTEEDLEWVKGRWRACAVLMCNPKFNLAIRIFAKSLFARSTSMALLALWGALENLFSPGGGELSFRISANIAVFLEPPGKQRFVLQKNVAKLYNARSAAAHGNDEEYEKPLRETYFLMRRVITKMMDEDHVPTPAELRAHMFGA